MGVDVIAKDAECERERQGDVDEMLGALWAGRRTSDIVESREMGSQEDAVACKVQWATSASVVDPENMCGLGDIR